MQVRLGRYAALYVALAVGLTLLAVAIETFAGFAVPSSVVSVVPPALAAMLEGSRIARSARAPMPKSQAWREALRMTGVALVINIAMLAIVLALPGSEATLAASALDVVALVMAILMALILLVNRYFLAMGMKNELKRLDRLTR